MNWTGGQPGETVTLKVIEAEAFGTTFTVTAQAPATAGTISIQGIPFPGGGGYSSPFRASSNVEIDVEVGPDPSQPQIVSAPGLTLGALVNWKYQYRFVGLVF